MFISLPGNEKIIIKDKKEKIDKISINPLNDESLIK